MILGKIAAASRQPGFYDVRRILPSPVQIRLVISEKVTGLRFC
jgi:hypothetical protein